MAEQVIETATQFLQPENSGLCYAMVFVNKLRLQKPEELERAVKELTATGHTRIGYMTLSVPGKGPLVTRLDSIKAYARKFKVDFKSMLLALSLADAMNQNMELQIDHHSGAVVSVDGNSTFKGGKAEWNEQAAQRIFGSQALNAYTPVDRSAWEYAFLSGKLNLQPISLFVGSDTGRHILLIEKVQNGRVYLIDSIDTKYEYFKSLFSSARAEGTTSWSVSVEDLLDSGKIAYVIAPRDSFVSFRPLSEAIQHGLDDFCVIAHLMSEQEKARLYLGKNKPVRRRSS